PAPAAIYLLSLHDALPILSVVLPLHFNYLPSDCGRNFYDTAPVGVYCECKRHLLGIEIGAVCSENKLNLISPLVIYITLVSDYRDRKSTRLNSSHVKSSYA